MELGFPRPASKTLVAVVVDVDNYLGRSQFSYDPYFSGTVHEFRIYDRALTAAQVADSFSAGESL